jgi:acyl-CoA reductase-like NAD-dependent aldehyde dehydrogenase
MFRRRRRGRHRGGDVKEAYTNGSGKHAATSPVPPAHEAGPTGAEGRPATAEEVTAAVSRSREAQRHWADTSRKDRIATLKRAAKEMLRRRAEVIELARTEMGKVRVEGLFNEALGPLDAIGAWASVVERATRRRHVRLNPISFPKKSAHVDYLPRGVVGVIAPWNFPVAGLYRSVFPALMTGNGVVLKPSEFTPRTSAWLLDRLAAELPDGLVSVVQGDGAVGAMLVDAGVDACVFTGSPASGRKVRIHCAERGIPSSIEMGGKDPAIVLGDCDLPRTVAAITHWALANAGQACGAIEIAYVDERIADDFVERLRTAWSQLRVAGGPEGARAGSRTSRRSPTGGSSTSWPRRWRTRARRARRSSAAARPRAWGSATRPRSWTAARARCRSSRTRRSARSSRSSASRGRPTPSARPTPPATGSAPPCGRAI